MSIIVACQCGKKLRVGDDNAGKRIKCPYCSQPVAVPKPGQEPKDAPLEKLATAALQESPPASTIALAPVTPTLPATPPTTIPEIIIQRPSPSLPDFVRPMDNTDVSLQDRGKMLATIRGGPVIVWHAALAPSMFGTTTLQLFERRVVEMTTRIISSRDSELLLSDVDSAEIVVKGNPALIILGLITLAFFGLGLIPLILYFIFKHRFLIIHTPGNVQAVAIQGDETPYRRFMAAVLRAAENQKRQTDG